MCASAGLGVAAAPFFLEQGRAEEKAVIYYHDIGVGGAEISC